jgi:hypothetical protein
LQSIVPEYQPSNEVLAQCEFDRHDLALHNRMARAFLLVTPDSAPPQARAV